VECPSNLLLITDAPGLGRTLARTGLALTAVWAAGFALLAIVRIVRASPARRRLSAPVLVPAVIAVALFAADALHGLDRGFLSNDVTDRALRMAEAGALALVAAGVALVRWRAGRTRAALARLVLDIGAAPAPGELRSWLADSLGDPSLQLLHRLDGGEWIDADGRPADLPTAAGRETTRVRAGGADVLAVVHRPGLLDDPGLLSELVTTARLALEHEGLHAAHRARLEELRASRARLVAAADAKRRELERDLHDGAQQRLVAIALSIRLARRGIADEDPELEARLATAEEGVRVAVVQLREVAHGLFPAVLAEEGLRAALDELSEQTPRLLPRSLPDRRFDDGVESAAYFAARESLRSTQGDVTVEAVAENGHVRLTINAGAGFDGAVTQIRDRVGAVGGTVTVAGRELRLDMPCE
jgi:signal transduction histidine kinase